MSIREEFLNFIDELLAKCPEVEMSTNVKSYLDAIREQTDSDKPMFTENGKQILKYMQDNLDITMMKSKDIAEGLCISSRGVSGAMRKLVTDGYVEKIGQNPIVYTLTNLGKEINLEI